MIFNTKLFALYQIKMGKKNLRGFLASVFDMFNHRRRTPPLAGVCEEVRKLRLCYVKKFNALFFIIVTLKCRLWGGK